MKSVDLFFLSLIKLIIEQCNHIILICKNRPNKLLKQFSRLLVLYCSPCGKYITCAAPYNLIWFDLLKQKQIAKSQQQHERIILTVRYSPSGRLIASGSRDRKIIIWDVSTLNQIGKTLEGHEDIVQSVAFSPDSLNLISGSDDKSIRIWDMQSQQQVGESIKLSNCVMCVEYSHNGLQFLSAEKGNDIDIWDCKTRQRLCKIVLNINKSFVRTATYSFDDKQIVSGSVDGTINIWDAITGQQIGNDLIGHQNGISSVSFSPDQRLIVSGSYDKTVRLWNRTTGKQESLIHMDNQSVFGVRFSNNGRYILSVAGDKTISIAKMRNY